jgi:hypothetical protein
MSRSQGHSAAGRIRSTEKSNDLIGNRTRDLPARAIVPQPTTLPRARYIVSGIMEISEVILLRYVYKPGPISLYLSPWSLNMMNEIFKASVPHYVITTEPNRLMLFRETVAVCCENQTEHINRLRVDKTQNLSDVIKRAINAVTIVFYRINTNCRIPWVKHIYSRSSETTVVTATNMWQRKLNKLFCYKDESHTRIQISWREPEPELRTGLTSLPEGYVTSTSLL